MSWLGEKLKALLDERDLSIQKVATDLGIERAYISMIIHSGRIPSEELTRRLAAYFGEDEEEWAFHTKAEPVMEDFRKKYPNWMPRYARKVTGENDGNPQSYNFSAGAYLTYNSVTDISEREISEFLPLKTIKRYAREALRDFSSRVGLDFEDIEFPLDAELLVRKVFGLEVIYDDEGVLDDQASGLLGCLFPHGHESPWGTDGIIAVNCSPRYEAVTDNFTILHEAGHNLFHVPLDAELEDAMRYCRPEVVQAGSGPRVPPREWQASRFASEVLMPGWKVTEAVGGPTQAVDLKEHGAKFRKLFGVSQAAMEKRLNDLGYKTLSGQYNYGDQNLQRVVAGHRRAL